MVDTEGRRLLAARVAGPGAVSQSSIAKALGCKQPSVSAWVRGDTRPEHHFREALERLHAIPAASWMTDSERAIATGVPASSTDVTADAPATGTDDN